MSVTVEAKITHEIKNFLETTNVKELHSLFELLICTLNSNSPNDRKDDTELISLSLKLLSTLTSIQIHLLTMDKEDVHIQNSGCTHN